MKIFKVTYQKYSGSVKIYCVVASTIDKAIADAKRHIKRYEYDATPNIVSVEQEKTVDIFYRS